MSRRDLSGYKCLVIEDDFLVAYDLMITLELAGAMVLGPVAHVQHAMEVLHEPDLAFDAAILDVHLHGETVFGAAEILLVRRIPFIFVTGGGTATLPGEFAHAPCLQKPATASDLITALLMLPRSITSQ